MNTTLVSLNYLDLTAHASEFRLSDDGDFQISVYAAQEPVDEPVMEFTGSVLAPSELQALLTDLTPVKQSLHAVLSEQLRIIRDEWRQAVKHSKGAQRDDVAWTADLQAYRYENAYKAVQTLLAGLQSEIQPPL